MQTQFSQGFQPKQLDNNNLNTNIVQQPGAVTETTNTQLPIYNNPSHPTLHLTQQFPIINNNTLNQDRQQQQQQQQQGYRNGLQSPNQYISAASYPLTNTILNDIRISNTQSSPQSYKPVSSQYVSPVQVHSNRYSHTSQQASPAYQVNSPYLHLVSPQVNKQSNNTQSQPQNLTNAQRLINQTTQILPKNNNTQNTSHFNFTHHNHINTYSQNPTHQQQSLNTNQNSNSNISSNNNGGIQPLYDLSYQKYNQGLLPQNGILYKYVQNEEQKQGQYTGYKIGSQKHGNGKMIYNSGKYYIGDWKLDNSDGYGQLFYKDGELIYKGEWSTNNFDGFGEFHNKNSQINTFNEETVNPRDLNNLKKILVMYLGEFYQGQYHGCGTITFIDGTKFHGIFQNDKIHGRGSFIDKNESIIVIGEWAQNMLIQEI